MINTPIMAPPMEAVPPAMEVPPMTQNDELFEQVWNDRFTGDGTLNVHIRRLREEVERQPSQPQYILTVWGDGYQFCGGRS